MSEILNQVGRPEIVVGWCHSHPGFGCWLSGVDMNTPAGTFLYHAFCQRIPLQSFEALNPRAVAVVVSITGDEIARI